jgi:hypothetical protein
MFALSLSVFQHRIKLHGAIINGGTINVHIVTSSNKRKEKTCVAAQ